ncbi:MAG: gamma-glutamyltransferase family protein [Planctomycetota bacterium]|nr:gamma-glutamyltransferase family protein [Planctomycetota bacterium]
MQKPEFDWSHTYASSREGVLAHNVVATSQPLAAQAGLRMMQQGGNAIDAAIATAITLTVVEPTSNGIGSDNFALIWAGGGLHGMNSSGRSPRAMTPDKYKDKDSISMRGWDGVTTPGCVWGWVTAHKQFGVLPFEKLFEPAIEYARHGFLVTPIVAYYWGLGKRSYRNFESWQQTFAPDGNTPQKGQLFRSEAHARTLEEIAESKGESFYRGALAEKIDAHAKATGGLLTADDLALHDTDWVRPIEMDYKGYTLHEIPPNGQGLAALLMVGILRNLPVAENDVDSAQSIHFQLEAMKLAFADAHRYIADPAWMDVRVEDLLDPGYLESRANLVDPDRAQDFNHGQPKEGGTVLLTTADAEGNMVSWIQSNYGGFGSGIVIPDTGIALQNRGCCFTLEEGHPNQIGGAKRPYHTIIPAFVTKDGKPLMAYGVMGGLMQPQGHAQVLVRIADYGQNPQSAIDGPRWRVSNGLNVALEPEFDASVAEELRDKGHNVNVEGFPGSTYGRGQAIYKLEDGYFGGSDGRCDGQAVGY